MIVDVQVPPSITGEPKSKGPALALVGIAPFGQRWAIDGRVGVDCGGTEILLTANGASASDSLSKDEASLLAGVGASYAFNDHCSVRLDHLCFDTVGDQNTSGEANVGLASLGVRFQF